MPAISAFRRHWLVLLPAMALAACGGSGGDPTAAASPPAASSPAVPAAPDPAAMPADQACGIPDFAQGMLAAVNTARRTARQCGTVFYPAAEPLAWNDRLAQAAAAHSTDMATNNFLSHTGSDGRTLLTRIEATAYRPMAWGENVAGGPFDVDSVMAGWLASPGHCANIMNGTYKDLGAACVRNDASTYKRYWTQDFAAPR